jgi:hypothetical protein
MGTEIDAWLFGIEAKEDCNKIQFEIETPKNTTEWIRRNFDKKKVKVIISFIIDADD